MTRLLVVRYLVLLVPLGALLGVTYRHRHSKRTLGALLLAFLAALVGVAVLDRVADAAGWWSYRPVRGAFGDLSVDLWLGWAVFWGPLPVALGRWVPPERRPVALAALLLGVGWLDALVMPQLVPLARLGPGWGWGELAGLLLVAAPSIVLGELTASARCLRLRVALQMALFAGLVLWLVPSVALAAGGGSWHRLTDAPRWQVSLLAQAMLLAAVPGIAAVREFVERGGGTPYPWDPPERLVTTGPYAYLANPMQVSAVLMTGIAALATASWVLAATTVTVVAFSEAIAEKQEDDDLRRRFGDRWTAYRSQVRRWRPRRRPAVFIPATLYLDLGCRQCTELRGALDRLEPVGLMLADARDYPGVLTRVRYERGDGTVADGPAAVARAAEHLDAGLATLGWLARLPLVRWAVDRLAVGVGLGPSGEPVGRGLPSAPELAPSSSRPTPADGDRPAETRTKEAGRWRKTPGGD